FQGLDRVAETLSHAPRMRSSTDVEGPENLQLTPDPARLRSMPSEPAPSAQTQPPASATSAKEEGTRLDQALEDLAACESASVSLIHCPNPTRERSLVKDLSG